MPKNPVIAIVGGVRKDTLKGLSQAQVDQSISSYRDACKALGASLAKEQMRLLVWSSDPQFIEYDVVTGYLETQNQTSDSIICIWNQDHFPNFPFQDVEDSPILLKFSHYDDWEIGFYESINQEAHGIILLGGGPTTLLAGVSASSWGKAVFTTPHFHGKAEVLYRWMRTDSKMAASAPICPEDIELMSQPWDPNLCISSLRRQLDKLELQKEQQELQNLYYSSIVSQLSSFKSAQRLTAGLFLSMLGFIASMVGAIAIPEGIIDFICFFLVLVFGGALGSLLSLLGTQRYTLLPIASAAAVGAGVGIIVGVVQVSPNVSQVITSGTILKVDIPLIFSSAVFALLGGLAFESTLQNLISRSKSGDLSPATGDEINSVKSNAD